VFQIIDMNVYCNRLKEIRNVTKLYQKL